jgi:hypothetical protein
MVQLQVRSLEAWAEASTDEYYTEVIVPDEQKFFVGKKVVMGLVAEVFAGVEGGEALVG